jgi:4-amino-4-deoxy-L-arabinose transferase-like glycosyltransferase
MPVVDELVERQPGIDEICVSVAGGKADGSPESHISDRKIAFALLLLSFGYLSLFRRFTQMEPDEGIVLQGAQRILRGEIPYRDFFSFLTPGSYYLMALIFKSFGSSMMVARTALAALGAICPVVTFLLARRVCSRNSALFAGALVALTTVPYRFLILHNWDSTLLACLAAYSAVRLLESFKTGWAVAAGTFSALTLLFEQSKGAGLCLGIVLGFSLISFRNTRRILAVRHIAWALCGFIGPVVLTFMYFAYHQSTGIMIADWLWPLRHYSGANHVFYGSQNWSDETRQKLFESVPLAMRAFTAFVLSPLFIIPVLPILAVGFMIYWIPRLWRESVPVAKARYYVLVTSIIFGLLLSVVIGRADILHFVYLQPLFMIVLAWIFDARDVPGTLFQKIRPVLVLLIASAFLLFSVPLLLRAVTAHEKIATRRGQLSSLATDTVVNYAQAQISQGSSILVYPYLPLYYYLTGTYAPGSYDYFQPGMHSPKQAREFLTQLESAPVSAVLFESSFAQKVPTSWPGTPLDAIARDPIADYILARYRSCKILHSPEQWIFLYMVRKDLPCP